MAVPLLPKADYLYYSTQKALEDDTDESNERLKQLMFGGRGEFSEIQCINIITVIQKQIKMELVDSKVWELYEQLSNLVHPNYQGVWDVYFQLNMQTLMALLECHDKGNIGLTILTAVHKAVGLSELWYEKIGDLLPLNKA